MVGLAIATGIPASVWAAEGDREIATAVELLKLAAAGRRGDEEDVEDDANGEEPQMSG